MTPILLDLKTCHDSKNVLNGIEKKQIHPTYSSTSIQKHLKTNLIHPCRLYCFSKCEVFARRGTNLHRTELL